MSLKLGAKSGRGVGLKRRESLTKKKRRAEEKGKGQERQHKKGHD